MSILNDDDRENLSAYLDGELDDAATQELEAKLASDPEARKEVEALRQAWNMLDYLPKADPSPNFTNRTMERLSLQISASETGKALKKSRGSWWPYVGWPLGFLAALGLGIIAGSALWSPREPTPEGEDPLVQHLRAVEKVRLYEFVDDVDFLKALDHPELFGDDS